jgi:hypothetical protein
MMSVPRKVVRRRRPDRLPLLPLPAPHRHRRFTLRGMGEPWPLKVSEGMNPEVQVAAGLEAVEAAGDDNEILCIDMKYFEQ